MTKGMTGKSLINHLWSDRHFLALSVIMATALCLAPATGSSQNGSPSPQEQPQAAQRAAATGAPVSNKDLSPAQLESLVGRIALYPDDLLALVLPASTQPVQIVQAQRFLDLRKTDPKAEPPKSWDPAIVALLNYPEVIALMNSDLTWTEQLGSAVIDQQGPLMDAIQNFRRKAEAAGNLKSNDKQKVITEKPAKGTETIVIQSESPDVIYVPSYDPTTVVVPPAVGAPYPYIYSPPYPYYYAPGAAFFTGAVFGAAIGYGLSWNDHVIHHGDVNINNSFNRANVSQINTRDKVNNITGNRENAWRPDRNATTREQRRLTGGGAGRPATSESIRRGLAERGGQRPSTGAAQRPATGRPAQRPATSAGQRPPAQPSPRATSAPSRPRGGSRGAGQFGNAGRSSSAFAGAGNATAANRASTRGNQSLGRSSYMGASRSGGMTGGGMRGGGMRGGGRRR